MKIQAQRDLVGDYTPGGNSESMKKEDVVTYTEKDMIDCFTAGVKFGRDMMNNPSNSEYIQTVKDNSPKPGLNVTSTK